MLSKAVTSLSWYIREPSVFFMQHFLPYVHGILYLSLKIGLNVISFKILQS